MAPLVASFLIGVGAKIAIGLGASAVKKLMAPPTPGSPAAFPKVLETESARAAAPAALAAAPAARGPYDLPGRLAAEGVRGVAAPETDRGFGGPPIAASNWYDDGPLALYRRLGQAP